jgi:hypothetical protein
MKLRLSLGRVQQKLYNRLPIPSLKPHYAPAPVTDSSKPQAHSEVPATPVEEPSTVQAH